MIISFFIYKYKKYISLFYLEFDENLYFHI